MIDRTRTKPPVIGEEPRRRRKRRILDVREAQEQFGVTLTGDTALEVEEDEQGKLTGRILPAREPFEVQPGGFGPAAFEPFEAPPVTGPSRGRVEAQRAFKEQQVFLEESRDAIERLYPDLVQTREFVSPLAPVGTRLPTEERIGFEAIEGLQARMEEDPEGFLDDLRDKGRSPDSELVLQALFNASPQDIEAFFGADTETLAELSIAAWRSLPPEVVQNMMEEDPEAFVTVLLRDGGRTDEKEAFLRGLGVSNEDIEEIFSIQTFALPLDGKMTALTINMRTGKAFDQQGNLVGSYNQITREFSALPVESEAKDIWDAVVLSAAGIWDRTAGFFLDVVPTLIYPEVSEFHRKLRGDAWADQVNERNQTIRNDFRAKYGEQRRKYEAWVTKHPELQPRREWLEGAYRHPSLLKEASYFAYEAANIAPYLVASAVTAVAVTAATGNPLAGIIASGAILVPSETEAVKRELLLHGMEESQAAQVALAAGALIGSLEGLGHFPLFKSLSPLLMRRFRAEAGKELARLTMGQLTKKGLRTFALVEITETLTEVLQEAVSNAAIKIADEEHSLFEGFEDIAVKTAVAVAPLALVGGGASMVRVAPSQTSGLSDAEMEAKGWFQDVETGNWYEAAANIPEGKGLERPVEVVEPVPAVIPEVELTIEQATKVKAEHRKSPEAIRLRKEWEKAREEFGAASEQAKAIREQILAAEERALIVTVPIEHKGTEPEGIKIADELGVRFEGTQPGFQEIPSKLMFTDVKETGSTFTANTLEEARTKLADMREKFAKARPVKAAPEVSAEVQSTIDESTEAIAAAAKPGMTVAEREAAGNRLQVARGKLLNQAADALEAGDTQLAARLEDAASEAAKAGTAVEPLLEELAKEPPKAKPETPPAEVRENLETTGQPIIPISEADVALTLLGAYLDAPTTKSAWELTQELRREARSKRAKLLKARTQELIIGQGISPEEAINQATKETMAGELPASREDFFDDLTQRMRDALFSKVYLTLKEEPFEMMSTASALTNALTGKPIPREPGVKGGSAYKRLQRVFSPEVFEALKRNAAAGKTLKQVIEGLYILEGKPPIPVDEKMANYLLSLPTVPYGHVKLGAEAFAPKGLDEKHTAEEMKQGTLELRLELAKEPQVTTQFELPIEKGAEQIPLLPRPAMDGVIRVLKEIGMSPVDIGNFLRANKASFDFSFWRQQAPLIAGHPVAFVQANIEAWKAIWSQKSAEASWERITRDPLFEIYTLAAEEGGDFLRPLFLAKGTAQWRGTEEFGYLTGDRAIPKLTAKLPWVKLSARSFETGTNVHNWLIFKNYYKAMLKLNEMYASGKKTLKPGEAFDIQKEMVDFAKMLSNFSARGSLGKFKGAAPQLSGLFFAPRAAVGRILSVKDLINSNPRVRMEAWKNAATFVGTFGGMVLLGAQMGWWDVETDPKSAEFMSIRLGNTRIDPWGGFRPFLVFFTRAVTQTGVSSVTGAEYKAEPLSLLQTFIRGKASPLASLILDFWRGKNFIGEEVDVKNKKQWAERVAPFSVWDIYEAYMDDPFTASVSAVPALLGAGVQTYTGDWAENILKLGLPKYSDNLAYGLIDPRYDTADFWADTSPQFTGVDPATLTEEKGFPDYIRALVEAKVIKEQLAIIPNEKLVKLNADPDKGTTFGQYYRMWKEREKIVASGDKKKLADFDKDERTRNAHLGNFSQRQFALLNEYWSITDKKKQAEFLEEHEAEIGTNMRDDYLRRHPKENAQLAVWGQANILSQEAYTEVQRLMNVLDIPDKAMPENTMPPAESVETHFTYIEEGEKGGYGTWETQLILANDDAYREWKDLQPIDTPIAALELLIADRALYDEEKLLRETLPSIEDKDAANYEDGYQFAIEQLKEKNKVWVDNERRVEALKKGTNEAPTADEHVNYFVERGLKTDEFSSGSAEIKLFSVDNLESYRWLLDNFDNIEDDGGLPDDDPRVVDGRHSEKWNIPKMRLEADPVQRDKQVLFDAIDPADDVAQEAFKANPKNKAWLENTWRIAAFGWNMDMPEGQVEAHVAFKQVQRDTSNNSAESMLFRVDDQTGYSNMRVELGLEDEDGGLKAVDKTRVPIWRIQVQFRDKDAEYEAIQNDDLAVQAKERAEFLAKPENEDFAIGRREIEFYELAIDPADERYDLLDEFVEWKLMGRKGQDDERFLKENQDLYKLLRDPEVMGKPIRVIDFSEVPSVAIERLMARYFATPKGITRFAFRHNNAALEKWLVDVEGYKPVGDRWKAEEEKVKKPTRRGRFGGLSGRFGR